MAEKIQFFLHIFILLHSCLKTCSLWLDLLCKDLVKCICHVVLVFSIKCKQRKKSARENELPNKVYLVAIFNNLIKTKRCLPNKIKSNERERTQPTYSIQHLKVNKKNTNHIIRYWYRLPMPYTIYINLFRHYLVLLHVVA